jgi:hypothetical protein
MIRLPASKIELTVTDVQFHLQNIELNVVLRQAGYTQEAIDDVHRRDARRGNKDLPGDLTWENSNTRVPSTSSGHTVCSDGDGVVGKSRATCDSGAWDGFVIQRLRQLGIDEEIQRGSHRRSIVYADDQSSVQKDKGRRGAVGEALLVVGGRVKLTTPLQVS